MFKKLLGFGILELTPFSNDAFTLDTGNMVTIGLDDQDAEDEATCEFAKEVETLIRASNRKEVFTKPNKKAGLMSLNIINPIRDEVIQIALPDSQKIVDAIDSTKTKLEIYDTPGLVLSEWDKCFKAVYKPVGADQLPLAAKYWTTFPRAVLIANFKGSASAKPAKSKLDILSVGSPVAILGDETATAA